MKHLDSTETRATSTQAPTLREAAEAASRARAEYIDLARTRGARSAWRAYTEAADRARRLFAESRGWSYSPRGFELEALCPERRRPEGAGSGRFGRYWSVIDHEEHFRLASRGLGRPAAIVSHTYATVQQIGNFAADWGLAVEFLNVASWYARGTMPIVITAAEPRVAPSSVIPLPIRGRRA